MARTSRIPHPTGGTFIQFYSWAVRAAGRDAAAIIGLLDFLDRARESKNEILASRARILADLEGIVSRYAVDKALGELEARSWICRHEREIFGGRNISKVHEYSLNTDKLAEFIENQNVGVLNSERRCSEFRTDVGTDVGTCTVNKEEECKEREVLAGTPASTLDCFFEQLIKKQRSGDRERDTAAISEARQAIKCARLSDAEAVAALTPCNYPSQLISAVNNAVTEKQRREGAARYEATRNNALREVAQKMEAEKQNPRATA